MKTHREVNCIMMNFIACILHLILSGWLMFMVMFIIYLL